MSNTNYTGSVGQYKQAADVVSDLNVMIVEAPINYEFKRQLADIVYEIQKEETLKNLYQFLFEADNGMYGDGEEPYGHETLVGDARVLRESMEYYFATEITPYEMSLPDKEEH